MKNKFEIPNRTELEFVKKVLGIDPRFLSQHDWKIVRGTFSYSFYMAKNALKILFKELLKSLKIKI